MIIFNEEPNDIVSEKHICYYTTYSNENIQLYEVYEKHLKHPQAKDYTTVMKIDTRLVKELKRIHRDAHSLILLEATQNINKKLYLKD